MSHAYVYLAGVAFLLAAVPTIEPSRVVASVLAWTVAWVALQHHPALAEHERLRREV